VNAFFDEWGLVTVLVIGVLICLLWVLL